MRQSQPCPNSIESTLTEILVKYDLVDAKINSTEMTLSESWPNLAELTSTEIWQNLVESISKKFWQNLVELTSTKKIGQSITELALAEFSRVCKI